MDDGPAAAAGAAGAGAGGAASPEAGDKRKRPAAPQPAACPVCGVGRAAADDGGVSKRCVCAPADDAAALTAHVRALRVEPVLRAARPLLQKMQGHPMNRGVFNAPVDAAALGLHDYHTVITTPLDLGTISERLHALAYSSLGAFADDVRVVFGNARRYNPEGHAVHQAAVAMAAEFEAELVKVALRVDRDDQRRAAHSCSLCEGRQCPLCLDKCLKVDPPSLSCTGGCGLNVRRGAVYHVAPTGERVWCARCYGNLASVLLPEDGQAVAESLRAPQLKRDLLKRKFDDVVAEPWVRCTACRHWLHQVCGLYLSRSPTYEADASFVCPTCRLARLQGAQPPPVAEPTHNTRQLRALGPPGDEAASARAGLGDLVRGGEQDWRIGELHVLRPAPPRHILLRAGKRPSSAPHYRAGALPRSPLGDRLEAAARAVVVARGGSEAQAARITVRLVSNVQRSLVVPLEVRRYFPGIDVPRQLPYKNKAVMVFQEHDGVDVALFSMYVQEYDDACPEPNRRRVYVAYLDSVDYCEPRAARTPLYHEVLIQYLQDCRERGFVSAHIWACPPTRGNHFIFWCHPPHQRVPGRERLVTWYSTMLRSARHRGVVRTTANPFDLYFAAYHKDPAAAALRGLPPFFEGDFWPSEVSRSADKTHTRAETAAAVGDLAPRERAELLLTELMAHPYAAPFNEPVDPVALHLPDYARVIRTPMDLGTVKQRFGDGYYTSSDAFVEDVRLVFANARRYNPPFHPVHKKATVLRDLFDRRFEKLGARFGPADCPPRPPSRPAPAAAAAPAPAARPPSPPLPPLPPMPLAPVPVAPAPPAAPPTPTPEPMEIAPVLPIPLAPTTDGVSPAQAAAMAATAAAAANAMAAVAAGSSAFAPVGGGGGAQAGAGAPPGPPGPPGPPADGQNDAPQRVPAWLPAPVLRVHSPDPMSQMTEKEATAEAIRQRKAGRKKGKGGKTLPRPRASGGAGGDANKDKFLPRALTAAIHKFKDTMFVLQLQPPCASCGEWLPGGEVFRCGTCDAVAGEAELARRAQLAENPPAPRLGRHASGGPRVDPNERAPDEPLPELLFCRACAHAHPQLYPEHAAALRADALALGDTSDANPAFTHTFVDSRHLFLQLCQLRRYQFDSLRRAKHSSLMLLFHLHEAGSHVMTYLCAECREPVTGTRWQCGLCTDFYLCEPCNAAEGASHAHVLTPRRDLTE